MSSSPHQNEPKYKRTDDDLRRLFVNQIKYLDASSREYDKGEFHEAARLATVLRTLLLNRGSSRSLLVQLNWRDQIPWLSTALPFYGNEVGSAYALVGVINAPEAGMIGAPLCWSKYLSMALLPRLFTGGTPPECQQISPGSTHEADFDTWWTGEPVLRNLTGMTFSRYDLIYNVTVKDGGAHVDPDVPLSHHDISTGISLGWMDATGIPLPFGVEASLRQITWEVLLTLHASRHLRP